MPIFDLIDTEHQNLLYRHNLTNYEENPLKPHGLVYTGDSPRPDAPHTSDNPLSTSMKNWLSRNSDEAATGHRALAIAGGPNLPVRTSDVLAFSGG